MVKTYILLAFPIRLNSTVTANVSDVPFADTYTQTHTHAYSEQHRRTRGNVRLLDVFTVLFMLMVSSVKTYQMVYFLYTHAGFCVCQIYASKAVRRLKNKTY